MKMEENSEKETSEKETGEPKTGEQENNKYKFYKKIIIILILACPITILIGFATLDEEKACAYSEASLLATGIAIIGVAITVWTGLNIANSVNKKDLEKLQDGIKEQSDNLDELKNDTAKQSDEVKEMNIKMAGVQNDYYSSFLQELLKTEIDAGSLYLYGKFNVFFRDRKSNIVKIPLLMEIERILRKFICYIIMLMMQMNY